MNCPECGTLETSCKTRFDENRRKLSSVIDFADVTLNDPAHDFQNIVEYGGEEFFETVMKDYQGRGRSYASSADKTAH